MTSAPSSGALTRYRVMAYVTGVVLVPSCLLGLSFWPWYVGEGPAGWLWTAHGYLYIALRRDRVPLAYSRAGRS